MTKFIGIQIPIETVGGKVTVVSELGRGGQGTVYKVNFAGQDYALKWYHEAPSRKFYDNLKDNISKGAPNSSFLWPKFITKRNKGNFGYLMELRSPEYKDFGDFLLAKTFFQSVDAMINAALNICQGFRELHNKGYSYQDLNDGNFFINPKNGDVLICDNDNVAPFGTHLGVLGKCRYMAPEIVMRKNAPNNQSDRFSLSVILFLLFFNNHPLEGEQIASVACMTEKNEKKYYGSHALFIYDKNDTSNRPLPYVHKNVVKLWNVYPKYVRNTFIEQFSQEHLQNPNKRQTEKEWIRNVILRMRNELSICPKCGDEMFVDTENITDTVSCSNSKCKASFTRPPIIESSKYKVVIYRDKPIYEYLTSKDSENFDLITGEVVESKKTPGLFGLRNKTNNTWILTTKSGDTRNIEPDSTCPLLAGNKINFGNGTTVEIK